MAGIGAPVESLYRIEGVLDWDNGGVRGIGDEALLEGDLNDAFAVEAGGTGGVG
jgi:hypothetical protein